MSFEATPPDESLADPLPESPLELVEAWLRDARERSGQRNSDAFALATASRDGAPGVRMVLCRGFDRERGFLVFFTNRHSSKGEALADDARAAAVFHWDGLGRQARLAGPVVHSPDDESDAYFASRARLSQIAAVASDQSQPIASRRALIERIEATARRFGGLESETPIPRPAHWGGYRLYAAAVELWVESRGRAHDRAEWTRTLEPAGAGFRGGPWARRRLQP